MIKCYHIFLFTILLLVTSSCAFSQEKEEELSDVIEILSAVREVHMSDTLTAAYKASDAAFHLRNRLEDGFRLDYLYPFLADSVFLPEYAHPYWSEYMSEGEMWEVRENYLSTGIFTWDDRFDDIIPTLDKDPKFPNHKLLKRLSYPAFTDDGDKAVVFSEIVASVATIDILIFTKSQDGTWKFVSRVIVGNRWGNE